MAVSINTEFELDVLGDWIAEGHNADEIERLRRKLSRSIAVECEYVEILRAHLDALDRWRRGLTSYRPAPLMPER